MTIRHAKAAPFPLKTDINIFDTPQTNKYNGRPKLANGSGEVYS
jgi:hypothetical protein